MKTSPKQAVLKNLFDYVDGSLIWKLSGVRGFIKTGKPAGAVNKGYIWVKTKHIEGVTKCYALQRLVWVWHYGDIPAAMVIDHINRDPLDNRIENLRLASYSENSMNACGKRNRPTALPKNVYLDFQYNGVTKYRAQVCVQGRVHRVGGFTTPEAAQLAATQLRARHHKRFSHEG